MSLLDSVHSVDRSTGGAYYYPMSVFVIFWLSNGEALQFLPAPGHLGNRRCWSLLSWEKNGEANVHRLRWKTLNGRVAHLFCAGPQPFHRLPRIGKSPRMARHVVDRHRHCDLFTTALEAISILGSDNLLILRMFPCLGTKPAQWSARPLRLV